MQSKMRPHFHNIFKTMNEISLEINEYNHSFWSKYLLGYWLSVGSVDVCLLYIMVFTKQQLTILIIFFYMFLMLTTAFFFVIFTASSVNYRFNEFYKIFNRIHCICYLRKQIPLRQSIKVISIGKYLYKFYNEYNLIIYLAN